MDNEMEFTWDDIAATAAGLSKRDVECLFYGLRDVYDFREDGVYRKFDRDIEQSDLDLKMPPTEWTIPKTIPKKFWKALNFEEIYGDDFVVNTPDPTDSFDFYNVIYNSDVKVVWTDYMTQCMVGPREIKSLADSFSSDLHSKEPELLFPTEVLGGNNKRSIVLEPAEIKNVEVNLDKEYANEEDMILRLISSLNVKEDICLDCADRRYKEVFFGAAILLSEKLAEGHYIYLVGVEGVDTTNFKSVRKADDFSMLPYPPEVKILLIGDELMMQLACDTYHFFQQQPCRDHNLGKNVWISRRADNISEYSVYCEPGRGIIMDYCGKFLQFSYDHARIPLRYVDSKCALGIYDKLLDLNFFFFCSFGRAKINSRFKIIARGCEEYLTKALAKAGDRRPLLISDAILMKSKKFLVLREKNYKVPNSLFEVDQEGRAYLYFKDSKYVLEQDKFDVGRTLISGYWNGTQLEFIDIEESENPPCIGNLFAIARNYGCSVVSWEELDTVEDWREVLRVFPPTYVQRKNRCWGSLRYVPRYAVTTGRELRASGKLQDYVFGNGIYLVDRAFGTYVPIRENTVYPLCFRNNMHFPHVADKSDLDGSYDFIRESTWNKLRCSVGFGILLAEYTNVFNPANINRVWCAIARSKRRYKCRILEIFGGPGHEGMNKFLNNSSVSSELEEIVRKQKCRIYSARPELNVTPESAIEDICLSNKTEN